jgi:hypothetical protein
VTITADDNGTTSTYVIPLGAAGQRVTASVTNRDTEGTKTATSGLIEEKQTVVPEDTDAGLTFGRAVIKSSDEFLPDEWTEIVATISGVIQNARDTTAEGSVARDRYLVFSVQGSNTGVTIIVEKVPSGYDNYKVGAADFRTLYIKAASAGTFNITNAVRAMVNMDPEDSRMMGKVMPKGKGDMAVVANARAGFKKMTKTVSPFLSIFT